MIETKNKKLQKPDLVSATFYFKQKIAKTKNKRLQNPNEKKVGGTLALITGHRTEKTVRVIVYKGSPGRRCDRNYREGCVNKNSSGDERT